jgi:hypothetical protein
MRRGAWIMAAWMVQKHGDNAVAAVTERLAAMLRDHAEPHQLDLWCQIGRAVIEIARPRPGARETVH